MSQEGIREAKYEVVVGTADSEASVERYRDFMRTMQVKYPDKAIDPLAHDSSERAYIVKVNDEVAGILVGFVDRRYEKSFVGQRMFTDPAFRNKKLHLGKRLMDAAKEDFHHIFIFAHPFAMQKGISRELFAKEKQRLIEYYSGMDFKLVDAEKGGMSWDKHKAQN